MILSTSYRGKEFFRIGYYVYNNYIDKELLENPPEKVNIDALQRNILSEKPRITRFQINWGDEKMDEETEKTGTAVAGTEGPSLLQEKVSAYQENFGMWQEYQGTLNANEKNTVQDSCKEESSNPFYVSNSDNYDSTGLYFKAAF